MRNGFVAVIGVVGLVMLAACGGDEAMPPPAAPPPPPPVAATPPTPAPTVATTPAAPAKPTMAEMHTAIAKSTAEAVNAHDAKKFAATFAEDGVWNIPGQGELKGRAEIEKQIQAWFDGFKDMKFAFSRSWTKGDIGVYEWAWSGTNTGEFMGAKATEKPAGVQGVSIVWLNSDGSVKRNNHYVDGVTIATQLSGKGKARPVPTLAANMESWAAKGTPEEEKNVEAWKTMWSGLSNKKEAEFLGVIADDIEWNDYTMPESMKGKAEAKKAYAMITKAIPDVKSTPTTTVAVGDVAIVEYNMTGTQKGPMGPIPAKNKPVNVHGVQILQIKDGKVAKGWDYANNVEMLTQLGVMKAPAAAKAADPKAGGAAKPADAKAPATGDKKPAAAKPAAEKKPADAKPAAEKKPAPEKK